MKKLFGNQIVPACVYCERSKTEGSSQYCSVNRTLKNGKCRKFKYNPIMRTPRGAAPLQKYDDEEFKV